MNMFLDLQKKLTDYKDSIRGYRTVPRFKGQRLSEIQKRFSNWHAIPSHHEGETIIEVRQEDHTLSFLIVDDVCTEAYRFDG